MFVVKRSIHNPILVPNRDHYWESFAVFNLSPILRGRTIMGLYRAISAHDKLRTPEQISVIGVGNSKDGSHFKDRTQFIVPMEEWEKYGCEDPRVTYFEGKYYTFYTALSKYPYQASGIKVAVVISRDLKKVDERHLVTPFNAKAMTLFPLRVGGKIVVMLTAHTDEPPAKIAFAMLDKIEDLWSDKFWEAWHKNIDSHTIDPRRVPYDHVEIGAVPFKTKHGWLLIYSHIQNYFQSPENLPKIFGVEALLLDLNDPKKIIGRTRGPIFVPEEPYELSGYMGNIVFPSGALLKKDLLTIYYGAADTTACAVHVSIHDLLATMHPTTNSSMEFTRAKENPIIEPIATHPWESKATFNPAAVLIGKDTHILYRTLSDDNTSSIGYARSRDGITLVERLPDPVYVPKEDFEIKKISGGNSGCEDPRLTLLGETLYMCYTAFDSIGPPRVASTSISKKSFLEQTWQWTKPVLITPPGFDDKDTCLFPEKIGGKYFILHRVGNDICGDYLNTLDFKKDTVTKCIRILGPRINAWDSAKVGITAPPIKTRQGWLLLYHGVSKSHNTYRVGAVLLDLKDPAIVLARTADPVFEPVEKYEKEGIVNNVVFPCGMTVREGILYIYYGGADKVIGVATIKLKTIMGALSRGAKL